VSFNARLDLKLALAASALLHALILLVIRPFGPAAPAAAVARVSSWATSTVEVGTTSAGETPPEAARAPAKPIAASAPLASPPRVPTPPIPEPPHVDGRLTSPAPSKAGSPSATARSALASSSARPSASSALAGARAAAASSSAPSTASTEPSGALGALGLPAGVQHFAKAFAWALPEGGHRDAAWSELPLGAVGKAIVQFRIDANGHLETVDFDPDIETPAPLRRMIEHAVFLLRPRKFSLDAKVQSEGVERVSVEVSLSEAAPSPDEDANPRDLATEGHRAPENERAGYARFTLNSGRHLEAVLRRLAPK
jgi:hypothetical protein